MRIELTQQHINDGIRRSCRQCAVALALSEGLGKPVKVTGRFIHESNFGWDSVSGGEDRIGRTGRKLRFFINDFDTEPKAVKPLTIEWKDNVAEIVGEYEPLRAYFVHHGAESYHVKGKCGCIECEFDKGAFTEVERAKMLP